MENNIEWRDIPGWEGIYKIALLNEPPWATIKSLERFTYDSRIGRERRVPPKIFTLSIQKTARNQYYITTLKANNHTKRYYIHALIAEIFIPNPDNLPLVRHKNDNGLDNRLDNLSWGTHKDNSQDRADNGGRGAYTMNKELATASIELYNSGKEIVDIGIELGIPYRHVWSVIRGGGYSHLDIKPIIRDKPTKVGTGKKKVIVLSIPDRKLVMTFDSTTAAALFFGKKPGTIQGTCTGKKSKTCSGYYMEYQL